MGRMKDIYIDFLNAQEETPHDSPITREEWELRHRELTAWKLSVLQNSKLLEKEGEEDNGN